MPDTQHSHRYEHMSGTALETADEMASLLKQIDQSKKVIRQSKAILTRPDTVLLGPRPRS